MMLGSRPGSARVRVYRCFQTGRLRRRAGQPLGLLPGGSRTLFASSVEFGGHCLDAGPECAVA